jgi:signal transduction histidine kinase
VHDGLAERWLDSNYADTEWAKYAGSLLAINILWIVSRRFRRAHLEAADLQATLAERVKIRESELADTYARVSVLEQSRAVTAERERILRDMHDGVGASLATAMRQLEAGSASISDVTATLRESLDHLKLSIDAMNLPAGDVNALLAGLRYRLQPRIESAGMAFEWNVDLLPSWPAGADQAMRQLQFLLLEAISNALQHSGAGALALTARCHGQYLEIELRDNGKGLRGGRGRGMQSMQDRAQAIGAKLEITNATPGTRVKVVLQLSNAQE